MRILEAADILILTNDSTVSKKIRLIPLEEVSEPRCMTGTFPIMVLSLGQIPVRTPYRYKFQFEVISPGSTTLFTDTLTIDKRIWFWDLFSFRKNLGRQLGKALHNNAGR